MSHNMGVWYDNDPDFGEPCYYSGTLKWKSTLDSYNRRYGIWCSISITDNAGNKRTYQNGLNVYSTNPEIYTDSKGFYLVDTSDPNEKLYCPHDGYITFKVKTNISNVYATEVKMNSSEVKKGGSVTFDVKVDNIDNETGAYIELLGRTLNGSRVVSVIPYDSISNQWSERVGNIIRITYTFPKDAVAGDYWISNLSVSHKNTVYTQCTGNEGADYLTYTDDQAKKCQIVGNKTIRVLPDNSAADYDDNAPVITSLKVLSPTVSKPGVIKIQLNAEDESNIRKLELSIVKTIDGKVIDDSSNYWLTHYRKEFNTMQKKRSFNISLVVPSNHKNCQIFIDRIEISDSSGNTSYYSGGGYALHYKDGKYVEEYGICQDDQGFYVSGNSEKFYYDMVTVKDEFSIALQMGLNNPKLKQQLKGLEEGQTAFINIDTPAVAKKALFEAIKGKDVNLVLHKKNYEWVFNGKDITNPKDINLDIDFSVTSADEYSTNAKIIDIVFYKNGTLPGKANVRIKSDYTFKTFNLTDSIILYYKNEKTNALQEEKNSNIQLILDDTDKWLEFDVTHNSKFVASKSRLKSLKSKALKPGTVYKSKQYKCTFKALEDKKLVYVKPDSKNITIVDIPSSVKINGVQHKVVEIGTKAFSGCKRLKEVRFYYSIKKIGKKAFYKCTALKILDNEGGGATEIGASAFEGCTSLTGAYFSDDLEVIGSKAFYGCKKLKQVLLKRQPLSKIGTLAFGKCTALHTLILPPSAMTIGKQAFFGCKKLKNITILSTKLTAKSIKSKAFKGIVKKAKIVVPKGKKAEYRNYLINGGAPKGCVVKE